MTSKKDSSAGTPASKTPSASATPATPAKPIDRRSLIVLWIGIVLAVFGAAGIAFTAKTYWDHADHSGAFLATNAKEEGVKETASGLQYKMLEPGKGGAKPTDADVVLVNYEGKLTDGTTFDKSERPTPFPVTEVVPGFSEGLKLMPKGSKFRLWIKPSLGYGDKTSGPIPANSVLVFDVEMVDFIPEALLRQLQQQQQMRGAPGGDGTAPGGNTGK